MRLTHGLRRFYTVSPSHPPVSGSRLLPAVLILHLLRTQKVPLLQSRPSRPVMVVTLLGTAVFTLLTFTPMGEWIGLTALPPVYFVFLAVTVFFYLLWVTLAKRWYIRRYHELL